jgi:hypothetical protein
MCVTGDGRDPTMGTSGVPPVPVVPEVGSVLNLTKKMKLEIGRKKLN